MDTASHPPPPPEPQQRVIKVRRDYNAWVASETLEDYALRFTPRAFRKWGPQRVAHTALGGAASFLVLEALGATLLLQVGFINMLWAVLATAAIILAAGLPISVYAARYGLDMDLLTRGAGFGYIGSTITSLLYASFTFIFFALEAAIMAYALELAFDIPPAWGYLICSLVVIPMVTHGITVLSRMQVWTQPLALVLMVVPFIFVLKANPNLLSELAAYPGIEGNGAGFDPLLFGAALTVGVALITQMGEQADYLRFMPEKTAANRVSWWSGVLLGGVGWVIPGVLKMLGGAALAVLVLGLSVPPERAVDPNQMYLAAWETVFSDYGWAVAATTLLVVVCQLKINVTNAYAGSLAWSNFFARLTHSHPGRVVWVVFNTLIALMLMELGVFKAIGGVLGLYSNLAISWIMAVVADLVVNKPLGLSPKGIEFKRAHLYDVNPVGVGAMALASVLSILAWFGVFGPWAEAFSALVAAVVAFVAAPLIAWATKGRYYLARRDAPAWAPPPQGPRTTGTSTGSVRTENLAGRAEPTFRAESPAVRAEPFDFAQDRPVEALRTTGTSTGSVRTEVFTARTENLNARAEGAPVRAEHFDRAQDRPVEAPYLGQALLRRCVICERDYEGEDMASCPAYGGPICSLCCSLDARCHDLCKPREARVREQADALLKWLTPRAWWPHLDTGLVRYLLLMAAVALGLAGLMAAVYRVELDALGPRAPDLAPALGLAFVKVYAALMLAGGVIGWWMVLTSTSRRVAQEESNRQTELLVREIDSHRRTDQELQRARRAAESANQAKTRYLSAISHELRTPLNSILGYAQLLDEDPTMPQPRKHGIGVIRRGGEHLLGLIEGTLDIARIESGKLTLEPRPMRLRECLLQIVEMFELQATAKGLCFEHDVHAAPERVKADERRLTQILINLLGNAVKFTRTGRIAFRATHVRDMAVFEIEDTGPGIAPADLERVFEPFARGAAESGSSGTHGTGLGLTIAKMLTELMGGEMTVSSRPGEGTLFRVRLFLPALQGGAAALPAAPRGDYVGERRRVLVVDNEEVDRTLLARRLQGHGFEVLEAGSGVAALGLLKEQRVDAIFMDLAMPGIDGWATIRALRGQGLSTAPVAIVSANAFDKNLDNDVGITPADFITKPVRMDELLDWLGAQLQLQWLPRGAPPLPPAAAAGPPPPREQLLALQQVVALGYPRGVWQRLDQIAAAHPECAPWLTALRGMADQFQFDRLAKVIDDALAHAADR